MTYIEAKVGDEVYILAKELAEKFLEKTMK